LPGRILEHFETNTLDGVGSAATKSEDLLWCVPVGLEIGRSTHQLAGRCRQQRTQRRTFGPVIASAIACADRR
jgi:hypothetical protein